MDDEDEVCDTSLIKDELDHLDNRGLPVPPPPQLLMALRYYRTRNIQLVTGDLRGFSHPTVSRCIRRVSIALASRLNDFVRFPETQQEQHYHIQLFYNIRGMPGVAEIFRCRKGYFAINVLAVVGPRGEFMHTDVRNRGSVHDQTCSDRSALRIILEDGYVEGNFLGDNGYASLRYSLVPFERPLNAFERANNAAHIPTRIVIERNFGRWKKKFQCLKSTMLTRLNNTTLKNLGESRQDRKPSSNISTVPKLAADRVLWNIHIELDYPRVIPQDFRIQNEALLEPAPLCMSGLEYRLQVLMKRFM
ncbi:hypothetical protein QAD02_007030 [Eretmocerus hayati]|uniref:Uncharacterized protein n=1 Tax=Eretmocerus hayati TaxID=131215 RepID=A0ACC2N309_9HYME|nr:hypothetical protein QAD02_007030 [Eretmocerus hayati]